MVEITPRKPVSYQYEEDVLKVIDTDLWNVLFLIIQFRRILIDIEKSHVVIEKSRLLIKKSLFDIVKSTIFSKKRIVEMVNYSSKLKKSASLSTPR